MMMFLMLDESTNVRQSRKLNIRDHQSNQVDLDNVENVIAVD